MCFFFFSSRRRHTRLQGDWSSDVCSSDLATLGELVAWIIGWDLILEYAVGNIAVAVGWAGYFDSLLRGLGVQMPRWLVTDLWTAVRDPAFVAAAPHLGPVPVIFNLPALVIVAVITWLLVIGTKESARVNTVMVAIKVGIIGLFLIVGLKYVRPEQWTTPTFAPNGFKGISVGAAIIFFSYIGFDAVSTASEEAKHPQKDIPFGIIASLIVCTVLYIAIALVITGIIPWDQLNVPDPLAVALKYIHADWAAGVLERHRKRVRHVQLVPRDDARDDKGNRDVEHGAHDE